METSGFAAIGFTVWANSCPQTHTFKNKQLDISTNSFDSLDFLLRKYNSQSFKDMGFYDTEIRVKAKKKQVVRNHFFGVAETSTQKCLPS